MNKQGIAIFLILSLGSVISAPTIAQEPIHRTFHIHYLPNFYGRDDLQWQRFEITVPAIATPLDMHLSFVVDGKGTDYVISSPSWPQPIPLNVQIVTKPLKTWVARKQISYHFAFVAAASASADRTLTFAHSSHGVGIIEVMNGGGNGNVGDKTPGDKMPLFDQEVEDDHFHASTAHWNYAGYIKQFPQGMVHRMTIYLSFQPHTGPKTAQTMLYSRPIKLKPADYL